MFSALSSDIKEDSTDNQVIISESEFSFLIQNLPTLPSHVQKNNLIIKTKRELQALISAIETYGITPSLIKFVNYNGIIGRLNPTIAALENLSNIELTDDQTTTLINELNNINLELAEERLNPLQWFITIIGLYSGILPGIIK